MNHQPLVVNRILKRKLLVAVFLLALLLMSCNQTPVATLASDSERFTLALQGEQQTTLQSQAFGEALPTGNYLCVERVRGGKALGIILQGNTYWVAMSYYDGRFSNWQQGEYGYTGIQANPRYQEQLLDFRREPTVLRDSGTIAWLSGPMTAWYTLANTPPVQFAGQRYTKVNRIGEYTYQQTDYGEVKFRVWDTDVDCSQRNFDSYGGSW